MRPARDFGTADTASPPASDNTASTNARAAHIAALRCWANQDTPPQAAPTEDHNSDGHSSTKSRFRQGHLKIVVPLACL